ncbi:MAG: response regulator [Verrucomicrobia bacterium]|nr:response regulator [Verrucomicrobiota bacterium]
MPENAIKVLMLEDDFQIAELVQAILNRPQSPAFEVSHVATLAAAVQKLQAERCDVILADLTLPDSDGLATFQALDHTASGVPIVVLTGHEDLELETKILSAGAQDYLVKSHLDPRVLGKTLRCAVQRQRVQQPQAKEGRIIGFIGAKGGAGTTTVAVNVAHVLSRQGKNIIAAELRPYFGTFSIELGQEPAQDLGGLLGLSSSMISAQELRKRLVHSPSGLRVLFSPQRIVDFKEIEAEQADAILQGLSHMADYTIVDLPPQPTAACIAALKDCHYIVLVVAREPVSVQSAKRFLEHLKKSGVTVSQLAAVIVSHAPIDAPMELRHITTQLGCAILGAVPPATEALSRAQRAGAPLVVADPDNAAAVALAEIAARLSAESITPLRL